MRPRSMFPEGTATRTAVLMKQAKTVADYRRILCVHLRAAFGESNPVIAAKTGLSESTIRKVHAAFLRRGEAALTTRPRGGRRRAHLTVVEEAAVVHPFLAKAKAGAWSRSARSGGLMRPSWVRRSRHPPFTASCIGTAGARSPHVRATLAPTWSRSRRLKKFCRYRRSSSTVCGDVRLATQGDVHGRGTLWAHHCAPPVLGTPRLSPARVQAGCPAIHLCLRCRLSCGRRVRFTRFARHAYRLPKRLSSRTRPSLS